MRQFRLLKGASILNIFFGILAFLILAFVGSIGVFIALGETEILQPLFDLLGKETSDWINNLLYSIQGNGGRLSREILKDAGIHFRRMPRLLFRYEVSTILMFVGFVGSFLSIIINIYGSNCLLRNIRKERLGSGRVNKFRAFFISILSLPLAPVAGLLMLLGTLFAREPVESTRSRVGSNRRIYQRDPYSNPYGPMV